MNWLVLRGFLVDGKPDAASKMFREGVKVYPLSKAANPPKMQFFNGSKVPYNTVHANNFEFYKELDHVIQKEPLDLFDPELRGLAAAIGIRKGKKFAPDARMKKILTDAVAVGNATARAVSFRNRDPRISIYPNSQWQNMFGGADYRFLDDDGIGGRNLDARTMFYYGYTVNTPAMVAKIVGRVIARRVEDLALLLPLIAGPDGEDPHVAPAPLGDPMSVGVSRLRVAWFDDNGIRTPTPETKTAVRAAVDALAATGATIEHQIPPDLPDARPAWEAVVRADGFAWLWRLVERAGTPGHGSYDRLGWVAVRPGEPVPGDAVSAAVERADAVRSRLLRWLRPFDLVVSPVLPAPAVRHGESRSPTYGDTYSEIHNLTGWPAVTVRAGTSPEGTPIGVQLVAKPWREDVALAAARVVESATGGWRAPDL